MKALVVEDDLSTRLLIKKIVENEGYEVLEAEDGHEAWSIFQKEKDNIYIALLDWMMPKMDGIELCRRIRKTPVKHYVYIMFLTSMRDIEDIVEGLETGGDDYMTKPFVREELISRIRVGGRIAVLQRKLNEANRKLHILAITDPLTGILNRREFLKRLQVEIYRVSREKKFYSLIMLDIDHFKRVNDTLGHTAGDMVLIEIADRLKTELRPYDLIGRYGGEEFLIGTPGANSEIRRNIAERIRASICKKPFHAGNKELDITASLGITSAIPAGNKKDMIHLLKDMIERADSALYRAKNAGRNRVAYGE
ncbi:MAG: diguanylate cyclase [Desulfobacterales bacterium]|jgi:diguanylate cyclase (GGDEF)-like protein|nr:diguanylate cyclase [Desulfobacterales bacterium]